MKYYYRFEKFEFGTEASELAQFLSDFGKDGIRTVWMLVEPTATPGIHSALILLECPYGGEK